MKTFGISRPVPVEGHCYRNGAGQIRRLLSIHNQTVIYRVEHSGAGNDPNKRHTSHRPGFVGAMALRSFRTWLVAECALDGRPIPHPELRRPRANTGRIRAELAEAIKNNARLDPGACA